MQNSKLYIAVRDDFPDYMTPTLVAHAVLRHHLVCNGTSPYSYWLELSFKKCVVRLNAKEFAKVRALGNDINYHAVESWENNTLNGEVSCVTVVCGGDIPIPNVLKFAKLWKPLPPEGEEVAA